MLSAKDHPSPDVRLGVARGLIPGDLPETPAVLLLLMKDPDDEVRNWATFSLGQQTQYDSPEIRSALRECLNDTFEDVREEAIWGLALRRDSQGLQALLYRFESDSWCNGDENAACDILGLRDANVDELCDGLRALLG
jgi:HEAT repeat protein